MVPAFNIDRLFGLPRSRLAADVTLRSMGGAAGPAGTCVPISGDASRDPSRDMPAVAMAGLAVAGCPAGDGVESPGDDDLGGFPFADEAELAAEATRSGAAEGMRPPRRRIARAAAWVAMRSRAAAASMATRRSFSPAAAAASLAAASFSRFFSLRSALLSDAGSLSFFTFNRAAPAAAVQPDKPSSIGPGRAAAVRRGGGTGGGGT